MKQPKPKSKVSSMYDLQNIYTGDFKKSPAVAKAKSDKAKGISLAQSEKKKIDSAMQVARSKSNIKSKMSGSAVPKMKMKTPSKNYKK